MADQPNAVGNLVPFQNSGAVHHLSVFESNAKNTKSPLIVAGGFIKSNAEPLLIGPSKKNNDEQMFLELCQTVKDSGLYNFESCRISLHTKLNISFFRFMLSDYEDKEVCEFLEYGFPIGFMEKIKPRPPQVKNHKGVIQFPKEVRDYLSKELSYGAVLGPFKDIPFSEEFCISPLNTVDKKDSDERRVILDLSYPEGSAVNDGIPKTSYLGSHVNLIFPRVDDLVALVKEHGRGCLLYKRDLKRAYRQIPVDPSDVPLLGYGFEGNFYFDKFLSMGLRSAAHICQRVTNAIRFMCLMMKIAILNYLDDFAGASDPARAHKSFIELGQLLESCGIEESKQKACPPSTKMTFIGVLFDSEELTLSVTPERLQEILSLLEVWLLKTEATLQELQSLIGKLSFISSCVQASRVFMCRLLSWLRQIHGKKSVQQIPMSVRKDLLWWKAFLPQYNGISMMLLEEFSEPDALFSWDACPSGCGGMMQDSYFHEEFPPFIQEMKLHINALELLTIVVALKLWGSKLRGKKVLILCDNMSSCRLINRGFSRDEFHQTCLREICYTAALNEFIVRAQHIRTKENRVADILSRWHLSKSSNQLFRDSIGIPDPKCVMVDSNLFRLNSNW